MPSRSAQQCQQRLFNPPELRNLLACNLDLMPALRTRVPQQDASAGASPDVPHDFFTWKSCPLAQSWIDELPHCVPHLGGCPRAQRRALRTTRVAQWHTGQVGRRRHSRVLSLPLKSGWEQQIHCLPLLSQSWVLHQKRWRIKILANCPLLSLLPKAQQQNKQGTKILFHCTKLDPRGPSLMDRHWEVLGITSST